MTIIDQRILIPVEPQVVWEFISNLANNPKWIADCRNVSFLTTAHSGQGTRWRYSNHNNRDFVVQISAWYDNLGYEYTIVDGVAYKENRGRIRLQEIAEGTVVQWTFTYEVGGLLGGISNSLSRKRQVEGIIIDSLRTLWREITQNRAAQPLRESKALMRDAPNVEARAQYKPRHPSVFQAETQQVQSVPTISEPPIAEDDTRPRKPSVFDTPPVTEPESQPAVAVPEPMLQSTSEQPEDAIFQRPVPMSAATTQEADTPRHQPTVSEEKPAAPTTEVPTATKLETEVVADPSLVDTGRISVFDVFGLPKPSETQELEAAVLTPSPEPPAVEKAEVAIEEPAKTVEDTHPTVTVPSVKFGFQRRGWRVNMRRKIVKVRRL
jgi:hypothetical protein